VGAGPREGGGVQSKPAQKSIGSIIPLQGWIAKVGHYRKGTPGNAQFASWGKKGNVNRKLRHRKRKKDPPKRL